MPRSRWKYLQVRDSRSERISKTLQHPYKVANVQPAVIRQPVSPPDAAFVIRELWKDDTCVEPVDFVEPFDRFIGPGLDIREHEEELEVLMEAIQSGKVTPSRT